MRFKAEISKDNLVVLHSILASFDHISHKAALHLTPKAFKISLITDSTDAPQCFAEMDTSFLFKSYRIQSQSDNAILFEIGLDLLSWALASGKSADFACLKLVKRGTKPYLSFEAFAQSAAAMKVLHDIPIRILPPSSLVYYLPPQSPPPTVALKLPRGKMMRTIVQRLNTFSKIVYITAKQTGRLIFRVAHSQVVIKTFCNNLVPFYPSNLIQSRDSDNTATVKLDLRKLSSILNLNSLPWDDGGASIYIVNNATVLIEIIISSLSGSSSHGGTLDFYLPVMMLGCDEDIVTDGEL